MPELSQVTLIHWCVVWQRVDTETRYGKARVSAPINVRCRWQDTDQSGPSQEVTQEQYPRSIFVGQEVQLGSYIWGPGKIKDLPAAPVYFEVVGKDKTPDLKSRHYSHRVSLQKASKTLPELYS